MSSTSSRPRIRMPTPAEDRKIRSAAKSDRDAKPVTPRELAQMRRARGRPRSPTRKLLVSVRYSPEVVDYFKSTGEGWQARMDGVLRKYVARQARRG